MNTKKIVLYFVLCALYCVSLAGCHPTYPKERFKESVSKICRREYKLDVKIEIIGKTIAIYLPLQNLLDFNFSITKEASEKINNVILSVSRAAISTDAGYDFYCIIAHDVKIPEIQIVIIKSVNDVKRFMLNDISRGEYSKRMLVDIRLNPQSQKERAIKEVFEKMSLDKKWQEDVMNDFFRSKPAALGDIGYWNNKFYVKEVDMAEFLAEQIANRVRMAFREDKEFFDFFNLKTCKGSYERARGAEYFKFEIMAEPKWLKESGAPRLTDKVFGETVKIAVGVLRGYSFLEYGYIEILNQFDGKMLKVSKEDLEKFRKKKIRLDDILVQAQ